jgi:hypothetical protein
MQSKRRWSPERPGVSESRRRPTSDPPGGHPPVGPAARRSLRRFQLVCFHRREAAADVGRSGRPLTCRGQPLPDPMAEASRSRVASQPGGRIASRSPHVTSRIGTAPLEPRAAIVPTTCVVGRRDISQYSPGGPGNNGRSWRRRVGSRRPQSEARAGVAVGPTRPVVPPSATRLADHVRPSVTFRPWPLRCRLSTCVPPPAARTLAARGFPAATDAMLAQPLAAGVGAGLGVSRGDRGSAGGLIVTIGLTPSPVGRRIRHHMEPQSSVRSTAGPNSPTDHG